MTPFRTRVLAALALGILACLAACAINPATGKRQISLIGEDQEIQIGREQDKQIVATLGLYGESNLQSYVQDVGKRLAAESERPDLPWTFRVVDDPSVNAFALPGGFIYVTRGIMTHLNSEAELAAVLGHEIGHTTARHSVNQMSKAQLASLGLGIGAAVSDRFAQFGNVAQTGLQLLFLKYSRDDERQADELGLRYVVNEGYDPHPMADVFGVLDRLSHSASGSAVPNWLSTHPPPADRQQAINTAIAATGRDFSGGEIRQAAYYRQIDNMVFGPDPREGFFRGTEFLHPEMRFRIQFPTGYQTANQKAAVVGISEGKDAAIEITLSDQSSPSTALSQYLNQEGIVAGSAWVSAINGFPAASRQFAAATQDGTVRAVVAFVSYDNHVFQLLGYGTEQAWSSRDDAIRTALSSFNRLTDPDVLNVQPKRIQIVDLQRGQPLSTFASSFDASVDVNTLALINHLNTDAQLVPGRPYKVVVGGTT